MSNDGKGDKPRPMKVSKEVYELKHTLVFGTPEEKLEAKKKLIEMGVLDE